jgi:hypothetical protein
MPRAPAIFHLRLSFGILLVLLALAPAMIVANNPLLDQIVTILVLVALIVATVTARSFDLSRLVKAVRPVAILLALPAIWMVIQAIPLPIGALTHPVWISSANYLLDQATGYISLDQGRTIGCLLAYGSGVAALILTMLLARDRRQAEQLLLALNGVTVAAVLLLLVIELGNFDILKGASCSPRSLLLTMSSLGAVFSLAAAARVIERRSSSLGDDASKKPVPGLVACAIGFVVCFLAFVGFADVNLAIVAVCGVLTFASVAIFRRIDVPHWSIDLFLVLMGSAAMAAMWRNAGTLGVAYVLQLADFPSADIAATVQRIYADTGLLGNGAGTLVVLFPMYRNAGQVIQSAPSAATALTIEWGIPASLVLFCATLWLISLLAHGAVSRGRDAFYSAAAAGCTVLLLGLTLCNATVFHPVVMLLGEVAIGLGLAQRISRTG